MESPGSPYASSPESAPKRAPRSASPPPPPQERPETEPEAEHEEEKEKPTHLRFLVSNTAAGCIIGKGGSTINDFQSQSGARIQLSRSHEFFPGTNDRIIMVSGQFEHVIRAMDLVLEKLLTEAEESSEEARPKFRLVVPNSSCGGIIGKGGATIKSFIEDSHAGIKISPQDNNFVGLHDRLVTITGPLNTQLRAIYLILNKLSEDVHYPPNLSSPFPYAGLGFPTYPAAVPVGYMIPQVPYNNAVNYGPNGYAGGAGGRYQNNKPGTPVRSPANNDPQESHTIGVADEHIGAVVGRAGKNITEIIQGYNKDYKPNPLLARVVDVIFILHAEHYMNCYTAVVRHLRSSGVHMFNALCGAVGAVYGQLHGGANEDENNELVASETDAYAVADFINELKRQQNSPPKKSLQLGVLPTCCLLVLGSCFSLIPDSVPRSESRVAAVITTDPGRRRWSLVTGDELQRRRAADHDGQANEHAQARSGAEWRRWAARMVVVMFAAGERQTEKR